MTSARYTMTADPDVKSVLDCFLPAVSAEIDALQLPKLRAVVLGGGYGRGEGGVRHTPEGGRLYNDLDFFVYDFISQNSFYVKHFPCNQFQSLSHSSNLGNCQIQLMKCCF